MHAMYVCMYVCDVMYICISDKEEKRFDLISLEVRNRKMN